MDIVNGRYEWFNETDSELSHITCNKSAVAVFDWVSDGFGERAVACLNACEGIPTGDLEAGAKKDPSYWRMQSVRNAIDRNIAQEERDKLQEENARYLAAVREMEKMLPVLEQTFTSSDEIWDHDLAPLNAYRLALQAALANRSNP